ncbi:hypothetical protein PC39_11557 [Salinisphaera sp. PC39]|uniref:DUF4124 domain-containing protein n=1 Tax=Salinisphaera sp. PC39 TaxID=1304156 RepID=UPI0033422C9B
MNRFITGMIPALLAAAGAAAGDVYRWQGADGGLHYGDNPPAGSDPELVRPEQRAFDVGDKTPGRAATAGAADTDDGAGRTERIRREQCAKARERLESYRNAARIQVREDDGTRDMSAEERVQAIARAEADVAELCGDGED